MSNVIIITETKNKNGNYELTEKKLRDIIQEAYDKGYQQGALSVPISVNPIHYNDFNPGPGIKSPSDGAPKPWWGEVTCKNLSANSSIESKVEEVQVGEQIPIPGLEDL